MHVHASDKRLTEKGSAKLFVKPDGETIVQRQGVVSESDMKKYVSISNLIMRLCLKFGHKILCMVIMEKINREQ